MKNKVNKKKFSISKIIIILLLLITIAFYILQIANGM